MQSDQRKLEAELNNIYDTMDADQQMLVLLSGDKFTIKETQFDQASKRAIIEANLWFQVENLRNREKGLKLKSEAMN